MSRLLLLLLVLGCSGEFGPHPDARRKKAGSYTVGVIQFGQLTYRMRADSSRYARVDTVRVDSIRHVPEWDSIRNRLGRPEYWIVSDGGKHWKFSAEDMRLKRLDPIRTGHTYLIKYGRRDVWYAINGIWNIQNVKEIDATRAPE